jgi:hypothetical protein
MRKHLELKKKELAAKKAELATLDPSSHQYKYVTEQIDHILADMFEMEKQIKEMGSAQ